MLKAKFLIPAKSATIDSLTNQLTINGVIDEIQVMQMPARMPEFCLISTFERDIKTDPETIQVKAVISVNKSPLLTEHFNLEFKNLTRNRTVLQIQYLNITDFGELNFDYFIDGKIIAHSHISIVQVTVPPIPPKSPFPLNTQFTNEALERFKKMAQPNSEVEELKQKIKKKEK